MIRRIERSHNFFSSHASLHGFLSFLIIDICQNLDFRTEKQRNAVVVVTTRMCLSRPHPHLVFVWKPSEPGKGRKRDFEICITNCETVSAWRFKERNRANGNLRGYVFVGGVWVFLRTEQTKLIPRLRQ